MIMNGWLAGYDVISHRAQLKKLVFRVTVKVLGLTGTCDCMRFEIIKHSTSIETANTDVTGELNLVAIDTECTCRLVYLAHTE